ncbi:hypothetical protein P421_13880 [Heyndrickxia coagulans P38]|jgi:hypothetical protein|nr:hypothetical protein P421_13880 [Heyndrickxia coagulans P38]KYC74946.1 hypothetical protein B4096_1585 [Heyndrickxia coagulans]
MLLLPDFCAIYIKNIFRLPAKTDIITYKSNGFFCVFSTNRFRKKPSAGAKGSSSFVFVQVFRKSPACLKQAVKEGRFKLFGGKRVDHAIIFSEIYTRT